MPESHYIGIFTRIFETRMEAVCGKFVLQAEHSTEPTCPNCKRWILSPAPVNGDSRAIISDRLPAKLTPAVRDMGQIAREVGIVRLLLEHQRIARLPLRQADAADLVSEALRRLGCSDDEQTAQRGIVQSVGSVGRPGPSWEDVDDLAEREWPF
jgi:hypothetical protein